jgi:hypothetical protein
MTKDELIRYGKDYLHDLETACCSISDIHKEFVRESIKALEQQPSDDVMAIHTQGLAEGIRCAMCTNSMKNDRGCDGGCMVNEDMYEKVMETINNQMFSQPTSDDCVSRKAVIDIIHKEIERTSTYSEHKTQINIETAVYELPTAYDVEKVVAELKNEDNHLTYGGIPFKEPPIKVSDAIDIVEKGGVQ